MRTALVTGTVILTLSVTGDLAVAQSAGVSGTATAASPELQLTPQQRAQIYDSVTSRKLKVQAPGNLHIAVDGEVPPSMELYDFPDNIAIDVPATKFYKYTIVQNEVVLVDPTKMKVVDVIRR
jgi:hypothetical protein